ncbi:minor tail protein [Mycobacterium phage Imvubu]|uniref:Minor tail protein n=1 Tax=Mycobacterium phage Imvubu TaxID=2686233 RepID=A0A6B9LIU0_9CAUD|nr:minor tail protein [Mycobacterium phage Imvubu]QHB37764.1 minor tail protein [Mycobacterium phage Imvubu]
MPVVTDDQIISLHTARGVTLYQFLPEHYSDSTWSRDQRDTSRSTIVLPPQDGLNELPDIMPWLHHVTVFDGERDTVLWTGPIQKASSNRAGLTLTCRDHAAYLQRTRDPITKRWDAADPAHIAAELWRLMADQQAITTRVIERPDPEGERFDFAIEADEQMLDQTISSLVDKGLRWTVVSGAAIIGPVGLDPIATLGEDDFLGDGITLVRDGGAVYNDVMVRGADVRHRERVDYYGQNLQTIHNVDDMFGLSNVKRAAQQYVKHTGTVRTRLELPPSTVLHPDAPVSIDELMPSTRFIIEAHGIRQLMELTGVEVARRAGAASVSVSMESVEEDIELLKKQGENMPTQTLGGRAL